MTSKFVVIENEIFAIDTDEDIEAAQEALRDSELTETDVFSGEPDGLGDSYRTDQKLFAV